MSVTAAFDGHAAAGMRMLIRALLVAIVMLAGTACSPGQARREEPAHRDTDSDVRRLERSRAFDAKLQDADRLVRQGCYACLRDACRFYQELLDAGHQVPFVRHKLARTSMLIAVRERELGIVRPTPETIAPALDDDGDLALMSQVAAAIRPWGVGPSSAFEREQLIASREAWCERLDRLAAREAVAAYLLVAVGCPEPAAPASYLAPHPKDLALEYRLALRPPLDQPKLLDLLRREPRFEEIEYQLGVEAASVGQVTAAEERLRRALEALPELAPAAIALGRVYESLDELETAADFFARAAALVPSCREALLGQLTCLSHLRRHEQAVKVADTMITLGTWYMGEAYYWKAWNLHALGRLEPAWDAIETARRYMVGSNVAELSGVIAFDRGDMETARRRLEEAISDDPEACNARSYLGLVYVQERQWLPSSEESVKAAACYDGAARALEGRVVSVQGMPVSEERRSRLTARVRARQSEFRKMQALSTLRAATGFANAGVVDRAIVEAERALADVDLKSHAEALLAELRRRVRR